MNFLSLGNLSVTVEKTLDQLSDGIDPKSGSFNTLAASCKLLAENAVLGILRAQKLPQALFHLEVHIGGDIASTLVPYLCFSVEPLFEYLSRFPRPRSGDIQSALAASR